MSSLPASIAGRLGLLIPRLCSSHDGEVVATARAIERTLKASGCDFHDLAQSIAPASDFAWRGMVARCVAHAHRLSDREAKFVCDMNRWVGEPTEPQRNWLTAIFAKIERGRGAS